jgi:hypothetical protein
MANNPTARETAPAVTWKPTSHTVTEVVRKSVTLTDAPDITWKSKGATCRPYSIRFEYLRRDGGPWQRAVTIYAMRPESLVGNFFSPDDVYMPPQWLTDLIAAAEPDA